MKMEEDQWRHSKDVRESQSVEQQEALHFLYYCSEVYLTLHMEGDKIS